MLTKRNCWCCFSCLRQAENPYKTSSPTKGRVILIYSIQPMTFVRFPKKCGRGKLPNNPEYSGISFHATGGNREFPASGLPRRVCCAARASRSRYLLHGQRRQALPAAKGYRCLSLILGFPLSVRSHAACTQAARSNPCSESLKGSEHAGIPGDVLFAPIYRRYEDFRMR